MRDTEVEWITVKRRKPRERKVTIEGPEGNPRQIAENKRPATRSKGGKKPKRPRSEAVLIRPADGRKYADVLKDIRSKVRPDDIGVTVKAVRETRAGYILVELGEKPKDKDKFGEALRTAVGDAGEVRTLVPRAQVDIRDLDAATDEEEVKAALDTFFGDVKGGDYKISLSRANRWGNVMAFVEMDDHMVTDLDKAGHIKIGWVNCRVRRRTNVVRCYRCHGYGHISADCKATDRRSACWRCGQEGHKAIACTNEPKCCLCAEQCKDKAVDHVPGSSRCVAYLEARRKSGTRWR